MRPLMSSMLAGFDASMSRAPCSNPNSEDTSSAAEKQELNCFNTQLSEEINYELHEQHALNEDRKLTAYIDLPRFPAALQR